MLPAKGSRVLVIDDEAVIREVAGRALVAAGYTVLEASQGQEALALIRDKKPELVILDLRLPGLTGQQICQAVREDSSTQNCRLLVLTGLDEPDLVSRMLDLGADDYLPKPFDIKELVARVRAILRRPAIVSAGPGVIENGRIAIHLNARQVFLNGRPVRNLSPKEFDLLRHLVQHAPRVIDKGTLTQAVWNKPAHDVHPRTIDVHIRRIRGKLQPLGDRCLRTVPAIGYQWLDPLPTRNLS